MSRKPLQVYIGFDPREAAAFAVARDSIRRFDRHILISGLVLSDLQKQELYYRETERRLGRLWDVISGAHMSTEFAISRFLVPELVRREKRRPFGWALFMDCDVLVRANLEELRVLLDDTKAIMCVKHEHVPENDIKMDGQFQTSYPRKNWSSVMAFNCDHPAIAALNVAVVNSYPGRDLHRFFWLENDLIGGLPQEWNYLVGHTNLPNHITPKIVHFTDGGPWLKQFQTVEYADEWLAQIERWAA